MDNWQGGKQKRIEAAGNCHEFSTDSPLKHRPAGLSWFLMGPGLSKAQHKSEAKWLQLFLARRRGNLGNLARGPQFSTDCLRHWPVSHSE